MHSPPPPEPPKIEYIDTIPQHVFNDDVYQLLAIGPPLGLEEYFKELNKISCNTRYTLPSGNKFNIMYKGIRFLRNGIDELWEIKAKNKGAGIHIEWIEHTPSGWRLGITATKYGIPLPQDPQSLDWKEIAAIFAQIESGHTYTRPTKKPDGTPYKLILEVRRE